MDELTPVYRVEHFLDTIVNGSANPYDPVYRIEKYLAKIAGEDVEVPTPIYRVEMYLAYLCGMNVTIPEPIYRIEMYLAKKCGMDVETPVPIYRIEYWLDEWASGGSGSLVTVTGLSPLVLANSLAHSIKSLTQYGKCVQDGTPTPSAPVDIMCNNGAIKLRRPSGMPIAYQMVEWLKSTGSIAITGFKTKSTQEIETVFYRESRGSSYLYSSDTVTSGTTNTTAYLTTAGGNWRWDGKVATINPAPGTRITAVQNNDGVWINGTRYGVYTDAGEFVSTSDLKLSSNENTTVRIYAMTIREGETVTLDLVPVQRVTDNAYGFYDKVSGNFYTNANATFEAGDPIDDPVEIYTDGTDEVLTVRGKNLFDKDNMPAPIYTAYISNASGEGKTRLISGTSERTVLMPIEPNTTYTVTKVYTDRLRIAEFSTIPNISPATSGTLLASDTSDAQRTERTITTGATAAYLAIQINNIRIESQSTTLDAVLASLQVEEGSTATAYEPYVAPQTVNDVPMLLSVGGYADEAEIISGIKTGKVGVAVLDGAETDWEKLTSNARVMFYRSSNLPEAKNVSNEIGAIECTIATHGGNSWTSTADIIVQRSSKNFGFMNPTGFTTDSTVDEWKAYLAAQYAAGTPVILVYPLATETTEQTTPHSLHSYNGTTIVTADTNVDPVTLACEYMTSA